MTDRPPVWDAETYDDASAPQEAWGREVLSRLELGGEETVLDAGCGTGRVTELILERLPRGRVIGVDASAEMIRFARERLDDRVELVQSDLLDLRLAAPVDAIFSNACFHWISNHERLFKGLAGVLRPGGALEAQCGGIDNVAEFERAIESACGVDPFADYLRGMRLPWTFNRPLDTEARLSRAGFVDARCWLDRQTVQPHEPAAYARANGLAVHLAALPDDLHDEFVEAVIGAMPRPFVLEYVRMNISARRGDG